MNLPAGILPADCNIELFANPNEFGKCLYIKNGRTREFEEIGLEVVKLPYQERPVSVLSMLYNELFKDNDKAVNGLKMMGIAPEAMVEQFNYCNRGKLDSVPDITPSGKLNKEYFDCGRHGKCVGEGRVCSMMGLTFRELECLRLNSNGKDYTQIRSEMGFRNNTAVNSLMSRLRIKLDAKSKTELIVKAQQIGII